MSEETPDERPAPPILPPAPLEKAARKDAATLSEYLCAKAESLERELSSERDRARSAEGLLKQQESLRTEVESQLKGLSEQIRQQKALQDLEHDKRSSQGRIEALEERLDEMHKTWASLLKDAVAGREGESRRSMEQADALAHSLAGLRLEVSALKDASAAKTEVPSELSELKTLVPALAKARTEDERLLREQLREMISGLSESLSMRIREIDERIAREAAGRDARLQALERERAAISEASEAQREDLRRQSAAQRAQDMQQLREEFTALRGAVLEFGMKQAGADGEAARLQKTLEELRTLLARPEKARDEIMQGLEGEKRDLMQALRERTGQLHNYVLERREIERSLGESLMEMSRRLEAERDAHRKTRERIAVLEQTIEALKAEGELRNQELSDRQARIAQAAGERDELLKALTEESGKVRRQISDRTAGDQAWEEKVLELQKAADEERGKRMQAEQACSDARAQMQALTDHISRLIREKDAVESRFTDWERQRREMDDQLRKKDEMLGMLSTTFRNILKKPSE
ncbi:MAG: hypothetical protein WCU88_04425 [Elusimicrobiota bacterium]|jgi:chromosome segregation ATPase